MNGTAGAMKQKKAMSVYCDTARVLLEGCEESFRVVLALHDLQLLSAVDGSRASLGDLMARADVKKRHARSTWLRHVDQHGCATAARV